ncbi:MAG: HAD domain-containing protein [Intestinibaculum porci]|uniref:HAD domain-containing protein n=1 Tax=Intestinibaculum porci TaxID=2487118 RepID=UPI00240A0DE9|nr:HAD domain-containing protein [Intestinibaculum porci]MDD6423167.1 HAD domain-containing protein [Intestinibaculum porci]
MDNVIFLDCDGVLNNATTQEVVEATGFIGVDTHNLLQLYRLVKKSQATIVLSSTWQNDPLMFEYLKVKLHHYQMKIVDVTHEKTIYRGATIKKYILEHGITNYVILDDYPFEDFYTMRLDHHFVNTDFKYGLTSHDVTKALVILKIS